MYVLLLLFLTLLIISYNYVQLSNKYDILKTCLDEISLTKFKQI